MSKMISVALVVSGAILTREGFLLAAGEAYDKEEGSRVHDEEKIAEHVSALFDTNKGARLGQSYIASQVLARMNVTPASHSLVQERIMNFLKTNSGEQSPEKPEGDGKLFASQKGRGGGTWRQCDYVAPTKA